ncbi:MAG: Sua5 family C-terminal domain-containing protein, partial [Acidimicrobiales bacterium]
DRLGADVLLVVPPPATGVGAAVRDRLRRAAAASDPSRD